MNERILKLYSKHTHGEPLSSAELDFLRNSLRSTNEFESRVYAVSVLMDRNLYRAEAVQTALELVSECIHGKQRPHLMLSAALQMLTLHELQDCPSVARYAELSMELDDEDNRVNATTLIARLIKSGNTAVVPLFSICFQNSSALVRSAARQLKEKLSLDLP